MYWKSKLHQEFSNVKITPSTFSCSMFISNIPWYISQTLLEMFKAEKKSLLDSSTYSKFIIS